MLTNCTLHYHVPISFIFTPFFGTCLTNTLTTTMYQFPQTSCNFLVHAYPIYPPLPCTNFFHIHPVFWYMLTKHTHLYHVLIFPSIIPFLVHAYPNAPTSTMYQFLSYSPRFLVHAYPNAPLPPCTKYRQNSLKISTCLVYLKYLLYLCRKF